MRSTPSRMPSPTTIRRKRPLVRPTRDIVHEGRFVNRIVLRPHDIEQRELLMVLS